MQSSQCEQFVCVNQVWTDMCAPVVILDDEEEESNHYSK